MIGIILATVALFIVIFMCPLIHGADTRTNKNIKDIEDEEQMKVVSKMKESKIKKYVKNQ